MKSKTELEDKLSELMENKNKKLMYMKRIMENKNSGEPQDDDLRDYVNDLDLEIYIITQNIGFLNWILNDDK